MWTKCVPNTCNPPDIHLPPSALPPPWLLHFLCLPAHYCCRRSFAVITGEEKARSGLRLSFASCYHFSHLYPLPTSATLTPSLPRFCLWHTAIGPGWSEWVETRAELTQDGELLPLQLSDPVSAGWVVARASSYVFLLIIRLLVFALGRKKEGIRRRKPIVAKGYNNLLSGLNVAWFCVFTWVCCYLAMQFKGNDN